MRCVSCGCELPEGSKFCFSCGTKQPETADFHPVQEEPIQVEPVQEEIVQEEPVQEELISEETIPEEPVQEAYEEQVRETYGQEQQQEAFNGGYDREAGNQETFYGTQNQGYQQATEENSAMGYKFCPYCGARNDEDAIFCCSCGNNMDMNTANSIAPVNDAYVPKKKFPVKLAAGAVAAVAVVVIAVNVIGGLLGGDNAYVAYLKDGRVNQTDLDHYKKEPVEYSGSFGEQYAAERYYMNVSYSKDGKYIFYPTDVSYDSDSGSPEFRLNMQKVGKTEDAVKIDSSVWRYSVLENNKVIYIKSGNNTLYINDRKDNKEKIASDVMDYYIDKEEKNIVWVEREDGKYSIYQQDLGMKKDKKSLIKDADNYSISKNMKQIAALEEDTLYVVRDFKDKEKVSSGVSYVVVNSEDAESILYCKNAENPVMGADVVEDDCAESDAVLKEPEYDAYRTERVEKNDSTGKYEKVDSFDEDAYDQAYEAYWAKERRDDLRERLGEMELGTFTSELYSFKDGKETLVEGQYVEALYNQGDVTGQDGILAFVRYNTEEVPTIKMSEIGSSDVTQLYYENLQNSKETCIYVKGKTISLEENLTGVAIDAEKNVGYGLKQEASEEEERLTLLSFSVDSKSNGKCKVVAEEVDSMQMISDGDIYYLTDVKDGAGELYCNDKNIDSDVQSGTIRSVEDGILYGADYDSDKRRATLKLYNGKKDINIADDVHAYTALDDKNVVVLVDYSVESREGELKYYKGKEKLIDLDEDVTAIFGGTTF